MGVRAVSGPGPARERGTEPLRWALAVLGFAGMMACGGGWWWALATAALLFLMA